MGPVGGPTERLETRFGKSVYDAFDPLANKGGSLLQDHAIGAAAQYSGRASWWRGRSRPPRKPLDASPGERSLAAQRCHRYDARGAAGRDAAGGERGPAEARRERGDRRPVR